MSSVPARPLSTRRHGVRLGPALLLPVGATAASAALALHPGLLTGERLLGSPDHLLVQQWTAELIFFSLGVLARRAPFTAAQAEPRRTAPSKGRSGLTARLTVTALALTLLSGAGWAQLLLFTLLGSWLHADSRRSQQVTSRRHAFLALAVVTWLLTLCAPLMASLDVTWDLSGVLPIHDASSLVWQALHVGSTAAWVLALAGYGRHVLTRLRSRVVQATRTAARVA